MKGHMLLQDAVRSLFKQSATRRYPTVRTATPERLRGRLNYKAEGCTGCCLCTKECPANAIEIITVDKVNKQFVMRYHADRCIYCGQCVKNCRFGCIEMSNEAWELASLTKEPFTITYGEDADVERVLAGLLTPDTEPTP